DAPDGIECVLRRPDVEDHLIDSELEIRTELAPALVGRAPDAVRAGRVLEERLDMSLEVAARDVGLDVLARALRGISDAGDEGDGDGARTGGSALFAQELPEARLPELDLLRRGVRRRDPAIAELGREPQHVITPPPEPDRRATLVATGPHARSVD